MFNLAHIWAYIIAFAVLAYVVLDGFDLGLGILFPFFPEERDRSRIMNSIAPVWDGNETWLVLGGGGLFAAFPLAYSVVMCALYAPIIAMLLGLIFRGVAFEFRFRTRRGRPFWEWGFAVGSSAAAFAQGIAVGALVQGIPMTGRAYGGGWWDWLTPFSLLTGAALVIGYALLGATWLVLKTEGELQDRAYVIARWAATGMLVAIVAVSLWTPFLAGRYFERWFSWPALAYTAPVPILVAFCAWKLVTGLTLKREYGPFFYTIALFALTFVGLGISIYPFIVPTSITIAAAAAPDSSLSFLLFGTVVLIPLILAYTANAYWVFRGKVSDTGYH